MIVISNPNVKNIINLFLGSSGFVLLSISVPYNHRGFIVLVCLWWLLVLLDLWKYSKWSEWKTSSSFFSSTSVSPCRQYTSEAVKLEDNGSKKRYASYVKLQVGSLPPPHSPEPPPRHNRVASPLLRRNYIDASSPSSVRRNFQEGSQSPIFTRRYDRNEDFFSGNKSQLDLFDIKL